MMLRVVSRVQSWYFQSIRLEKLKKGPNFSFRAKSDTTSNSIFEERKN